MGDLVGSLVGDLVGTLVGSLVGTYFGDREDLVERLDAGQGGKVHGVLTVLGCAGRPPVREHRGQVSDYRTRLRCLKSSNPGRKKHA